MKSWTGRGAATRVYSPDFDADFSKLPRRIQGQIEEKFYAYPVVCQIRYSHYARLGIFWSASLFWQETE